MLGAGTEQTHGAAGVRLHRRTRRLRWEATRGNKEPRHARGFQSGHCRIIPGCSTWDCSLLFPQLDTQPAHSQYLMEDGMKGGFPDGSAVKNPPADAGDAGSIPGLERSSGRGNSNSLQYSCLENLMDRGAWWARVHGVAMSEIWLNAQACTHGMNGQ